jgi:hypothetical protein
MDSPWPLMILMFVGGLVLGVQASFLFELAGDIYKLWAEARCSMLKVSERLHQRKLELTSKMIELEKAKLRNTIQDAIFSIVNDAVDAERPIAKDGAR